MYRIRTSLALGCVTALTFALAGCGGNDALTAKEFRAQADKLCETAEKETDALGDDLDESSTEEQVTAAIDELVKRTEELADDIAALDAPDELADDVEEMVDSLRAGLKKIDDATMEELNSMENPLADADKKAKDLGLESCGDGN